MPDHLAQSRSPARCSCRRRSASPPATVFAKWLVRPEPWTQPVGHISLVICRAVVLASRWLALDSCATNYACRETTSIPAGCSRFLLLFMQGGMYFAE